MINRKYFGLGAIVLAALMIGNSAFADQRYIVNYKNNASFKKVEAAVEAAGGSIVRSLPQVKIAIAVGPDEGFASSVEAAKWINSVGPVGARGLPGAKSVALDSSTEPSFSGPTANDDLFNNGLQWGIDRVHAPEAWAAGNSGTHNTVVAIIDTGVASNHPDLAPNLVHEACYTSAGSDQDGACDPYPGYSDHGTHTAGTVAAAFDGGRVVGVGPNLGLAAYNVFEPIEDCGVCAYSDSRWMAMIDVAERGFQVINMSLGGYVFLGGKGTNGSTAYIQAEKKVANYVRKAGTIMIASSGNDGAWLNGNFMHVPSDIPSIVGVAATGIQPAPFYPWPDSYDIRAFYSNFGAASTVSAPGGDCGEISTCTGSPPSGYFYAYYLIMSTIVELGEEDDRPPACAATHDCVPWYGWKAGTSMASPHVAGVAGLIADKYPGMSPQEITEILKETADKVGKRQEFGHGIVNAEAATQ